MRTENFLPQDSGDVLDAIYQRKLCPLLTRVGVRRKLTLNQFREYLLTRVDKVVANSESYPRSALIPANYCVMPVHVLLVHTWVLVKSAFAAKSRPRGNAWTQITTQAGVAGHYVRISYHAVSILARNHAMKVCVALVRLLWIAVVIVVGTSELLSVASAVMKDQASEW